MINIPQIQNQERLPVPQQLKNLRSYLFQLANELQRRISGMESAEKNLQEELEQLKKKVAELEGR